MIDLDELERLAKAATQGPWKGDRFDGSVKYDIVAGDYPSGKYEIVCRGDDEGNFGFMKAEDENYTLVSNPETILTLIAEMRALREYREMARKQVYELMGVIADIEQFGSEFDDACMNTIKRVRDQLYSIAGTKPCV